MKRAKNPVRYAMQIQKVKMLLLLLACLVILVKSQKKVAPNVNRVKLVHTVTWKVKNVMNAILVNIVEVKKQIIQLLQIRQNVLIVQLVGHRKLVAPSANLAMQANSVMR
jgi:hypothetical protein